MSTEKSEDFWFNNPRVLFVLMLLMAIGVCLSLVTKKHTPFDIAMLIMMFILLVVNGYRFIDRLIAEIKED